MRDNSGKQQKRRKSNKVNAKKIAFMGIGSLIMLAGVNSVVNHYEEVTKENKIKNEKMIAEKKKEEDKRRKEEEAKKKQVGVKHDAKKYSYDAKKIEKKLTTYDYSNDGKKIVFLTFDDGASTTVTPKVLDMLKKEGVKATFFLTGETIDNGGERARELVKKEFEDGHALANHSYSHDYKILYPGRNLDLNAFVGEMNRTNDIIKSIVGENFSTRVVRCPGGHMSWKGMDELDRYFEKNNLVSIDWNALSKDAEGKKKNAGELAHEAIASSDGNEMVVVLMHDTYGKEETAKSLPEIIKYYKDNGYEFKTLV